MLMFGAKNTFFAILALLQHNILIKVKSIYAKGELFMYKYTNKLNFILFFKYVITSILKVMVLPTMLFFII